MSIRDIDFNGYTPDDVDQVIEADPNLEARRAIAENLLTMTEVLDRLGRDALERMDVILAHLDKK